MCRHMWFFTLALSASASVLGCGDSGETEADRVGVGAECTQSAECESADEDVTLECLTQFAGGYCGLEARRIAWVASSSSTPETSEKHASPRPPASEPIPLTSRGADRTTAAAVMLA